MKVHKFCHATATLSCLLIMAAPSYAAFVFEEDFESPDTANFQTFLSGETLVTANNTWSITANSIDLYEDAARSEAVSFDGGQAVDLTGSPGQGVMETTFNTLPGTEYELVFHYARNDLNGSTVASAQVDVIGTSALIQEQVDHDPAQLVFSANKEFRQSFIADDTQALIRFSALTGTVAGVTIDAISVTRVDALPGDLDGDGFVGINDLNIILSNWNQFVPHGDLLRGDVNCDGFVGIDDIGISLGNWNAGTPPNAQANIPEPTTMLLMSVTGLMWLTRSQVKVRC